MEKVISDYRRHFHNRGMTAVFFLALIAGALTTLPAEAVEGLRLESLSPGELRMQWSEPDSTPPQFFVPSKLGIRG